MQSSSLCVLAAVFLLLSACGDIQLPDDDEGNGQTGIFIETVTPESGPIEGQTTITVVGGDFVPGETGVLLGGVASIDVEVIDANTLVFRAPAAAAAGPANIAIFNATGFGAKSDAYTYQPAIELVSISPTFGNASGGNTATLTGSGFQDTNPGQVSVNFAGAPVQAEIVNDSTITFKIPGGDAWSAADISVSSRNGRATLAGAYTFMLPGLLSVGTSNGDLLHIDPVTGTATQIRSGTASATALAMDDTGRLYAAHRSHPDIPGDHVAEIFIGDGTREEVIAFTAQRVGGIEVTEDQTLFASMRRDASGVVRFAMATGTSDALIPYPLATGGDCRGCALAQSPDGRLFAAFGSTTGNLFRLNGSAFEVAATLKGVSSDNIRGMTFAGQTLFALRRGSGDFALSPGGGGSNDLSTLIRIDPATGGITNIATFPNRLHGLAAIPLPPAN